MARSTLRGAGGGRRRVQAKFTTSTLSLVLLAVMVMGCNLDSPTSPNGSDNLTGQNQNEQFNFNGTVVIAISSNQLTADDTETIVVQVTVNDSSGNPISNLATVAFSTNLGAFQVGQALSSFATATTFNGVASVLFQSANRAAGTSTITASVGNVSSSASVTLDPAPVTGALTLAFGTTGSGATTATGTANSVSPLELDISAFAGDEVGAPVAGATVHFRFVDDDTTGAGNGPARFIGESTTFTNGAGVATNRVRIQGAGDLVMEADMIDPNSGQVVSTSNQIIVVAQDSVIVSLAFAGIGTSVAGPTPLTAPMTATVTDSSLSPLAGITVRFSITEDSSAAGASLSRTIAQTTAAGTATADLLVPDNDPAGTGTSRVVVVVEVLDGGGAVIATSNTVVASGTS